MELKKKKKKKRMEVLTVVIVNYVILIFFFKMRVMEIFHFGNVYNKLVSLWECLQ